MKKLLYFALLFIVLQSCSNQSDIKLPILGNREPVERIVDGKTIVDTIYQTIQPFSYFNQDSILVTEKDLCRRFLFYILQFNLSDHAS